jgi:hypothetical protein
MSSFSTALGPVVSEVGPPSTVRVVKLVSTGVGVDVLPLPELEELPPPPPPQAARAKTRLKAQSFLSTVDTLIEAR